MQILINLAWGGPEILHFLQAQVWCSFREDALEKQNLLRTVRTMSVTSTTFTNTESKNHVFSTTVLRLLGMLRWACAVLPVSSPVAS